VAIERRAVDAAREVEAAIGGVTADVSLLPGLVMADRLRLRHILKNLVSNALQHGGPSIVVKSAPIGNTYRIVVADDGPGLDQARLATLFEPYVHSAKAALVTGSLGLGLAVAKQLAEQMGCDLRYQRHNGYTLFVLDLPMADSAVSAGSSAGSRPDGPRTDAAAR
jgi:two-component system, OmpR family, sensor kinase